MDIKAYISSGILESYVLKLTTVEETAEVEKNIAQHPEIRAEIFLIEEALESYALEFAHEPPAELKIRIMNALAKEQLSVTSEQKGSGSFVTDSISQVSDDELNTGDKVLEFRPQPSATRTWVAAASWALLILSVGANIIFFNRWKGSEEKLAIAESQNLKIVQNEEILKANYEQELNILQSPGVKVIALSGQPVAPNSKALVYWDTNSESVYVSSMKLPEAPSGKQYQLWAIVDGKPVDAGLISGNTQMLKMKSFGKAVAFAISLEETGGSTTEVGPKGQIYVMGNV